MHTRQRPREKKKKIYTGNNPTGRHKKIYKFITKIRAVAEVNTKIKLPEIYQRMFVRCAHYDENWQSKEPTFAYS